MLLITTLERKRFCRNIEKSALQPDSDIVKSIYEERNVLVPLTIE